MDSVGVTKADFESIVITVSATAKYQAKNKYSWKFSESDWNTIMYLDGKITVVTYGSAENAYGTRGEVRVYTTFPLGNYGVTDASSFAM